MNSTVSGGVSSHQAANGHPAVVTIQEDGDVSECPDESCQQHTVTEPSAPRPDPVMERRHQATQGYTCEEAQGECVEHPQ